MRENDEDDDQDFLRNLYEDFRSSLGGHTELEGVTVEDLLDIFDYAGDMADDYVRMEALMYGARHFPDDERLAERRCLFYTDTMGPEVSGTYLADHPEYQSIIWDLQRMESDPTATSEEVREGLEYILENYGEFSDEEIIRWIKLVSTYQLFDWMMTVAGQLRAHCRGNIDLMEFEIARTAIEQHHPQTGARILQGLVDRQPYGEEFWLYLAIARYQNGDLAGARQAMEYARDLTAANPGFYADIIELGVHYQVLPAMPDIFLDIATANMANDSGSYDAVMGVCMAVEANGNPADALPLLQAHFEQHPEDLSAGLQILKFPTSPYHDSTVAIMARGRRDGLYANIDWEEVMKQLYNQRAADSVIALAEKVLGNDPALLTPEMSAMLAEVHLGKGNYGRAAEIAAPLVSPQGTSPSLRLLLTYLIGRYYTVGLDAADLRMLPAEILQYHESLPEVHTVIDRMLLRRTIETLEFLAAHPRHTPGDNPPFE